uniref:DNA-binding protein n=1 Tax=Streptomyces sp. F12 TaxID=1436084 RepID=V9ZAC7_9ACTN|nr:helix-turn-helix transcriptional regulator [Streptomyces sp. F12]AHE40381.1 DNA-binding protein [Streptomyces sp. F12]
MGQPARRTARRRRLGAALREARGAAGVTPEEAAKAIHGDKSKISRIETGRHRVSRLELETLMDLFCVSDPKIREWLVALSTEGQRRSWWRSHGDRLEQDFKELLSLEEDAERIVAFQPQVVPGLVQTRPYATSVIRSNDPSLGDEQVDFFADFRLRRQEIFKKDTPPEYLCIITEGVLHQRVGGAEVLKQQLEHLLQLGQQPNITVRVIPFSQTGYTGTSGAFTLYSYPDPLDLDVVQVEYLDGALYLEEENTIRKYRESLDLLRSSALPAPESHDLISKIHRDL